MRLLARLDDTALAQHRDGVVLAATGAHAGLRAAVRPLVARLAATDEAFAIRLRDVADGRLLPLWSRSKAMLPTWSRCSSRPCRKLRPAWTMVDALAPAAGARRRRSHALGAKLLESRDPSRLSIREQLARLGNHPFAAVRRFALGMPC